MRSFLLLVLICAIIVCVNVLINATIYNDIIGVRNELDSIKGLTKPEKEIPIISEPIDKLDAIMLAIMEVESEMNPFAVNENSGASGILQIMPIYVKECNRLLGEERYNMEDTKSIKYSIEMFRLINKHKNPENSLMKAIKIHNPRGGKAYERKVVRAYNKVLVMDNIVKINT